MIDGIYNYYVTSFTLSFSNYMFPRYIYIYIYREREREREGGWVGGWKTEMGGKWGVGKKSRYLTCRISHGKET